MSNDIATSPSLDAFFNEGVNDLQDGHYVVHGIECDICGGDERADSSEIVEQASSISSTAVVQTKTCPSPHVSHKLCLYTWLHTKLHKDEDATCPMCRTKFILNERSRQMQTYLQELQSLVRRYNNMIEESVLQRDRIEEEIKRAEQELQDMSTDEEVRRLVLRGKRRALITARNVAVGTTVLARQDQVRCLEAIIAVEARIAMSD